MTAILIKQGTGEAGADRVRPISGDAVSPQAAIDPRFVAYEAEIARLSAEAEEARQELERLQNAQAEALESTRDQAYQDGLKDAATKEDEALERLQRGVDEAVATFDEQLAGLERLSALLARECLDRIFGDDEQRVHLLHEIISHQIGQIEQGNLVAIEVCPKDFSNLERLAELVPLGGPNVKFIPRSDFKRSEISIKLTLGTLSVGLDQQWGRLRGTLTELAENED